MTEDGKMELADRLEHFLRILQSARRCVYQSISVWEPDVDVVAEAVAALRLAASLPDGSGQTSIADGGNKPEQSAQVLSRATGGEA